MRIGGLYAGIEFVCNWIHGVDLSLLLP